MNYIKLLNAAFDKFYADERLNPSHISLYMALFLEWNACRFIDEFYVNRRDIMRVGKIGSKTTYHRCIVELEKWSYLNYFPSKNPYKGSKIKMTKFWISNEPDTGRYNPILEQVAEQYNPRDEPPAVQYRPKNGHVVYRHNPTSGQALVSNINNIKQENYIKQPKDCKVVIDYFKEKNFDLEDAKSFYNHYSERKWLCGDGNPVRDWRALASSWVDRKKVFQLENTSIDKQIFQSENQGIKDNLKTSKSKDYGQPL